MRKALLLSALALPLSVAPALAQYSYPYSGPNHYGPTGDYRLGQNPQAAGTDTQYCKNKFEAGNDSWMQYYHCWSR